MIGGTYTALLSQARARILAFALSRDGLDRRALRRVAQAVPARSVRPRLDRVYLALGWSALIAVKPLVAACRRRRWRSSPLAATLYSIGVAFHLWQSLKFQNAIWHACVTAAAACQFAGVFQAVGR